MAYNGLSQRLSMDAAGVIAHYVMDGDQPLTANSAGNTTFYLYGLGAIGEETNAWSYSLPDGTNTSRQLTNPSGGITLSARYTPWGDTLDSVGTGGFTFGYFGGVMDAATGLLYVGNGQYYDPATGRFLTRDARPNNPNPYVPWNPIGAILGPLGVLSLVALRQRGKRNKNEPYLYLFIMLVVLPLSVGMACIETGTPTQTQPPTQPVPLTATALPPATATNIIPFATQSPTDTPTNPCPNCPPTPTQVVEHVNLSAYYTVLEEDYVGGKGPIKANAAKKEQVQADYLLRDTFNAYTNYEQFAQTARSDFLYDPAGLCTQGSGKLEENNLYISCTDPVANIPNVGFEWQTQERIDNVINKPLEVVAICPNEQSTPFRQGDIVEIPVLKTHMQSFGKDEFLTVADTGGGLCATEGHSETLDVYIGEGQAASDAHYLPIRGIEDTTVYIHRTTAP